MPIKKEVGDIDKVQIDPDAPRYLDQQRMQKRPDFLHANWVGYRPLFPSLYFEDPSGPVNGQVLLYQNQSLSLSSVNE